MGLSACHDHHHNSNNNNNDDDDQLAVEVQVLDGALNGALVFADLNRNFELDREEPYTYTDENGKATLKILNSSLKDPSGNTVNSFKMIAQAEKGDPDLIYGSETPLTTPVVMAREIFPGSIDGLIALSPFTTLTDMMVFPDALSSLTPETYQAMLTDIATAAGAGNAGVAGGFNDAITNENLHALIAAELLVRSGLIPGSLKDLAAVYNGSVVGNSPLETAASIKDDANTMVTELEENAQKEDRDITGDDVVKALTGYNPGGDTPDPDSGSDTDPDSGSDTDPDSGSDTDPDSGSDTDPDSGSGSDSDSETSMFDARLIMGGYVPEVQVC